MNVSTDWLAFQCCITQQPPPPASLWVAGIRRGIQVFVVWYRMSLREVAPGMKNPPLVTSSVNRSWVRHNECFHSGEMRWRGSMTSGLGEAGWGCFGTTGRWEETPRGRMNGQTDKKTRTDGRMASESFTLTSFSDVFRHFGGLLRRFCQCISFSWFVCVPSLSCVYRGWPKGAVMCVSFPKETS